MCGRYALHANEKEIVSHFQLERGFAMRSRYNIAPTQTIPIITKQGKDLEFARWGFSPPWDLRQSQINARLETITEKTTFKEAFKKRRCLIPASGYFEWKALAEKKQPFYFFKKNHPLIAFAGIWTGDTPTCAILTKEVSSTWPFRMPVIIAPENYAAWLLEAFTIPLSYDELQMHAVTSRMNTTSFEGKECIQPL